VLHTLAPIGLWCYSGTESLRIDLRTRARADKLGGKSSHFGSGSGDGPRSPPKWSDQPDTKSFMPRRLRRTEPNRNQASERLAEDKQ
jgi:hypothetical protein